MQEKLLENLDILRCPSCGGDLENDYTTLFCVKCKRKYQIINKIPILIDNTGNQMLEKQ